MRNPFIGKLPPPIGLEVITQEGFIDRTKHMDMYSTLPAYLGRHAEESGCRPRMPGYSLPTRAKSHWFIVRRGKGDVFGAAAGSLFNALTVREPFPVTRLLLQLRIRGE